jgi:hypothetical protein
MRNVRIAEKKLAKVAVKIGNDPIKFSTLCRHLNKEFKTLKVKFKSKGEDYYSYCVTGFFNCYSNLEFNESRYNVDIAYDKAKPTVKPKIVLEQILLVLVHELRHGYQDNKRKKKILPFERYPKFKHFNKKLQENVHYLGDYDELDAYAFEAAFAFKRGMDFDWIMSRYKKTLGKHAPALYQRFLKKFYLNCHK